jgi:thiamine phosphate synthase YjbQ (UPF0047 family)
MPAHIKSTLIGASINVPITNGRFNLGTWQGKRPSLFPITHSFLILTQIGIYLCEHRNIGGWGSGHTRKIVITIQGTEK